MNEPPASYIQACVLSGIPPSLVPRLYSISKNLLPRKLLEKIAAGESPDSVVAEHRKIIGARDTRGRGRAKPMIGSAGSVQNMKPQTGSTEWDEGHGERYQTRCADCGSEQLYHTCANR